VSFWETFRDSYRDARASDKPPKKPRKRRRGTKARKQRDAKYDELKRLLDASNGAVEELRGEKDKLTAALGESETALAECRGLVEELAVENQRLAEEVKAKRRSEPASHWQEKFKSLRRLVRKTVHPDMAGTNKPLASVLERIAKELNAEIDRIEAA
jgi:predicted nuclease with TOPRIM domain